ncbi:hypothetical protein KC573_04320, partial [candidate division WWE3 bacterium]|nr:hypothetical protein [candidate division WWE3 bacterium]
MDLNNILTQWLFSITFEVLSGTGLAEGGLGAAAGIGGIAAIASLIGTLLSGGIASALAAVATTGGTAAIPLIGLVLTGVGALAGFLVTLLAILYGRVLIIWIITIVGPVMFALSTLPWTSSLRDKWWKTLIPIAFMQTIIAMLMSVGVILMSVPNEGGSLFASAGVFITGLVTMISMIKSPQLSMQLLGGGGLAGQAFGAVSGVASKLGGAASGLTAGALGGVAGGLVGGLTPEARAERQAREDSLKVARPDLYEGGRIGRTIRRIGAGGRNYQYAKLQNEAQLQKEQKQRDKTRESAEKTAIAMSKADLPAYDQGKIRGRVPTAIAGRLPGSQRSRLERQSEANKLPDQQMRVRLKLSELDTDAYSAVANSHWYDDKSKFSVQGNDGTVAAKSIPTIFKEVVESSGLSNEQKSKLMSVRSIDLITHSEKGIGSEDGIKVKEELLKR